MVRTHLGWRGWHPPGSAAGDEILVANRVVGDGEFEHPVEEQPATAGVSAIEAEYELIQVAGQVRILRCSLVGAYSTQTDRPFRRHGDH